MILRYPRIFFAWPKDVCRAPQLIIIAAFVGLNTSSKSSRLIVLPCGHLEKWVKDLTADDLFVGS